MRRLSLIVLIVCISSVSVHTAFNKDTDTLHPDEEFELKRTRDAVNPILKVAVDAGPTAPAAIKREASDLNVLTRKVVEQVRALQAKEQNALNVETGDAINSIVAQMPPNDAELGSAKWLKAHHITDAQLKAWQQQRTHDVNALKATMMKQATMI